MTVSPPKLTFTFIALAALALTAPACVQNRTAGGNVDDLTSDVSLKGKLLKDGLYDYSDVDITVFEGRLLLTGTMRSEEGKAHAGQIAEKAQNVSEVINEVSIGSRTTFRQGTSDASIDSKLGLALLADNGVYRGNYQIAVSGGTVYLLGVAQGPTELARVTEHARTISGVNSVVSHVIYVGDPRRQTRAKPENRYTQPTAQRDY